MKPPAISHAEMRRRMLSGATPAPVAAKETAPARPVAPVETASERLDRTLAERRRANEAAEAARQNVEAKAAQAKADRTRAAWGRALTREPDAASEPKAGHRDAWKRALTRDDEAPASEAQSDPRDTTPARRETWG